jgi:hypothetical protein
MKLGIPHRHDASLVKRLSVDMQSLKAQANHVARKPMIDRKPGHGEG